MITELLIDIFLSPLQLIISLMPSLSFISLPDGLYTWFADIASTVGFFLPITDLILMFSLWILISNFEFFWKLILKIWDLIPFV